jgi:hypothetical protein
MQKNPIYELSATLLVSFDHNQRFDSSKLTIKTVDLMLICECRQIGNEEQIKEELDIGSLFVMLELRIIEQSLVMSANGCFVWIRILLRLSLNFCLELQLTCRIDMIYQRTLPKRNAVVAHLD